MRVWGIRISDYLKDQELFNPFGIIVVLLVNVDRQAYKIKTN